jgi:hypothetical protein
VGLAGGTEGKEAMGAVENKKNIYTVKEKEEKKEIGGGGVGGARAFSLLLGNPKSFILAIINVWGLVVGTLIIGAFNTRRYCGEEE